MTLIPGKCPECGTGWPRVVEERRTYDYIGVYEADDGLDWDNYRRTFEDDPEHCNWLWECCEKRIDPERFTDLYTQLEVLRTGATPPVMPPETEAR